MDKRRKFPLVVRPSIRKALDEFVVRESTLKHRPISRTEIITDALVAWLNKNGMSITEPQAAQKPVGQ